MLEFADFFDIAEYGNTHWKGSFTKKEVAMNAYDYLCEYHYSLHSKKRTHTIIELLKLLEQDRNGTTEYWIDMLLKLPV